MSEDKILVSGKCVAAKDYKEREIEPISYHTATIELSPEVVERLWRNFGRRMYFDTGKNDFFDCLKSALNPEPEKKEITYLVSEGGYPQSQLISKINEIIKEIEDIKQAINELRKAR